MNYDEALNYIHSSPKLSKPLGNQNLKAVLKELGSPENKLRFVHIAGTNGKGSVSAMTDSVLRCAGYRTGLFTSPFLERFNERIKFNGEDINDEELAVIASKVADVVKSKNIELAEFSVIFAIALLYFEKKDCDVVVLETGLGGRLDATNAIGKSIVAAVTSVGFDHMQYLGNTIQKIAREKAGIIKNEGHIVLYPEPSSEVFEVFSKTARDKNAELTVCSKPLIAGDALVYKNKKYRLSLKGSYQYSNAAVCLEIIEVLRNFGFSIDERHIAEGFETTVWPGRFEWISERILLDGCHNIDGVTEFVKSAKNIDKPITIVTGVMQDKDYHSIAQKLSEVTKKIVVTKCDVPRSLEVDEYKKAFEINGINATVCENSAEAVRRALENDGVCAVCGSLYLIGEVRKVFKTEIAH